LFVFSKFYFILFSSEDKLCKKRQNFLFSATLISKIENKTKNSTNEKKNEKQIEKQQKALLKSLIEKVKMSKEPKMFDLTTKQLTADTLVEYKILCSLNDKDIYMFYLLSKNKGRTLVFANSIDCVRRLSSIFRLLNRNPLSLHANMNQKQRLKNLEKFHGNY
jgi:ATP-dependent RNA helicase DDX24/MAK5